MYTSTDQVGRLDIRDPAVGPSPCISAASVCPPLVSGRVFVLSDKVRPTSDVPRPSEEQCPAQLQAAGVLESQSAITLRHAQALLPLLPFEPFGTGQAFFSGVKADAGRAVLQPAMRLLPNSCKLLAKFVKQTDCKFRFNSIAIFRDVSTSPHRDPMNGSYRHSAQLFLRR